MVLCRVNKIFAFTIEIYRKSEFGLLRRDKGKDIVKVGNGYWK
jgi:hypothetical protein